MKNIDCIILAGGMGTRLQSVLNDKPKCMAPVNGRPFIDIILDKYIKQGLQRFILCLGYLKEQVIQHLKDRNNCEIVFSKEDVPLGTGGALCHALPHIKSNDVLIMNGDSYINVILSDYIDWYYENNYQASIVVTNVPNIHEFGSVQINSRGLVTSFEEKKISNKSGIVNAGLYLVNTDLLKCIPTKRYYSLEEDFFPKLVSQGLSAYPCDDNFVDIGSPESYMYASIILKQ